MPKRAAIYTRISEKDEKVDKVDIQQKRLVKYAADKGYSVVGHYSDDGISAYSGKHRPEFTRMVSDVRAGKLDVLLAVAQDRFTRKKDEGEAFMAECAANGVTWDLLSGGPIDPSDAMESMTASLRGMFAQLESDIRKVRLQARFDSEVAEGRPLWGVRPFGYNLDRLTLHETEAAEVRWAYSTLLKGGSIYSILKSWNERGILTTRGNQWAYASVQQLMKRPRNAGIVMRNDEEQEGVKAAWEPLVSREEFDSVVALLSDPARSVAPGRKRSSLLAGIARCECGAIMRSGTANRKPYLKCSRTLNAQASAGQHASIAAERIDPLVRKAVAGALVLVPANALPGDNVDLVPLDVELAKVRTARQDLVSLIGKGLLKEGEAAKELGKLKAREEELETERDNLARQSARASILLEARSKVFLDGRASLQAAADAQNDLAERFDLLPLEQRRELVRSLLTVVVHKGRSLKRVEIARVEPDDYS